MYDMTIHQHTAQYDNWLRGMDMAMILEGDAVNKTESVIKSCRFQIGCQGSYSYCARYYSKRG